MEKNQRKFAYNREARALGNNLTLEELSQIEEMAHRSPSREAVTILRLSAALREAMQIRESAIAFYETRRLIEGANLSLDADHRF